MRITRTRYHATGKHAGQTEIYEPYRLDKGPNKGLFEVAIKKTSENLNKKANAEYVETLAEVADRVRKGYSARLQGNLTGQRNLICPGSIRIT